MALAAVFLLAQAGAVHGQNETGFSGRWVLESAAPARQNFEQFWLGADADVVQTSERLQITRIAPSERTAAFLLDGGESQNAYTIDGARVQFDSRTSWSKASLLISTDTTTANGDRWLSHIMRWAIDADGTLVVTDTRICGRGECPSVVTTLRYRRK